MKNTARVSIFLSTLSLLVLNGCLGIGGSVGPVQGRLVNHTRIATTDFTVRYELICRREAFIGPKPRCGQLERTVHPDETGRYEIPAMDLTSGGGSEYELNIEISFPDAAHYGRALYNNGRWTAFDGEISNLVKDLSTITVLSFEEQKLAFNLASGTPGPRWAAGPGRDSYLRYTLDFSLGQGDALLSRNILHIDRNGVVSDSIETLDPVLLFVPGDRASDTPVLVTATLANGALSPVSTPIVKLSERIAFAPVLPDRLRTFVIDDRAFPEVRRTIDGRWNLSLQFNEEYAPGYENNFFDGPAELRCIAGTLQGTVELKPRGGNTWQWQGQVALTGTCSEETGSLELRFRYASNRPETAMSIRYDRITGVNAMLLAKGHDFLPPPLGGSYTRNLKIFSADGKKLGNATIGKN